MAERTLDELITFFNDEVSEMEIPTRDKMTLLGMITSIGFKCDQAAQNFRDCRNELCLKCGEYRQRHLGACDGCRWKERGNG